VQFDRKEAGSGVLFLAGAGFFLVSALRNLDMGSLLNMGPGYFPVVLAGLLVVIGGALIVRSFVHPGEASASVPVATRALVLILAAPIVFGVAVIHLGFIAAIVLVSLVSGAADVGLKPRNQIILALGLAAFCTLVFRIGLGLPIPLFPRWLG
jgi:hypothetical protein